MRIIIPTWGKVEMSNLYRSAFVLRGMLIDFKMCWANAIIDQELNGENKAEGGGNG